MNDRELVELAKIAKENAFAPLTKFSVGAAIETKSGKIYTGCNIESPSDLFNLCAERTALVKAISEGEREIVKIAVASDDPNYIFPCGNCRQAIAEFGIHAKVIATNCSGDYNEYSIKELLPHAFTGENIDNAHKAIKKG